MKTAAVGNTVPSHEVTRLMLGRTFSTGRVVLSSVWEHKLLQATFLYNNMWYLAMSCRGMLGRVILSQLCGCLPICPSWRISLSFKGSWTGPGAPGQMLRVLLPMLLSNTAYWILPQNTVSVSRCKSIQETSTLDTINPEKQKALI